MKKYILLVVLLCASKSAFAAGGSCNSIPVPAGITSCYYISAAGADTNNGTTEATPFLHSPGMQNCANNCASATHTAGQGIIFRGGDTWHFGNAAASPYAGAVNNCAANGTTSGGLCIGSSWSGTLSNPIYVGFDVTWFSGGLWARPILTGDNPLTTNPGVWADFVASCPYQIGNDNNFLMMNNSKNVIVDNFEIKGVCGQTQNGLGKADRIVSTSADTSDIIEHLYVHGWSHLEFHCNAIFTYTAVPANGGSGYFLNDTGFVISLTTPSKFAAYKVTGVSGTKATLITITDTGTGYGTGVSSTQTGGAQPGIGTGLTINVTGTTRQITSSALFTGGINYLMNDTGTIIEGANNTATYKVTGVGAMGMVTSYQITFAGVGSYDTVNNPLSTSTGGAQPGVGTGLTINSLVTNAGGLCYNLTIFAPGLQTQFVANVVDGSDSDPGGTQTIFTGGYVISQNVFRYTSQIITTSAHLINDNLLEHWFQPADLDAHGNMLESSGDFNGTDAVYGNIFRNICSDAGSCPSSIVGYWPNPHVGQKLYFFNNLYYGVTGSGGVEYFNIGQNGGGNSQGTLVIFNNTLESGAAGVMMSCSASANAFPLTLANNHHIHDTTPYAATCAAQETAGSPFTELVMSHASATTNGYTSAQTYAYSPTLSSSPTVGVGTNEQPFCTELSAAGLSDAATACQADTRYACTFNSIPHTVTCPARASAARPPVAAWDIGAFSNNGTTGSPALMFANNVRREK